MNIEAAGASVDKLISAVNSCEPPASDRYQLSRGKEPANNTIILIDRSVAPVYPEWTMHLLHPELEHSGPSSYALETIALLFFRCQQNGLVETGTRIYDHLKSSGSLGDCLSLRDGEEISRKGVDVYREFFGNKPLLLWKSVVQHGCGYLFVPHLCGLGTSVALHWRWLKSDWDDRHPAGVFPINS